MPHRNTVVSHRNTDVLTAASDERSVHRGSWKIVCPHVHTHAVQSFNRNEQHIARAKQVDGGARAMHRNQTTCDTRATVLDRLAYAIRGKLMDCHVLVGIASSMAPCICAA